MKRKDGQYEQKKTKKQHYFVCKEITAEQTADEDMKDMIEVFGEVERIELWNEQSEGDGKPYRDGSELYCSNSDQTNSSN